MARHLDAGPGDFAAQAGRVVDGLDGGACVLATRDGLALGAHPIGRERAILARWADLGRAATTASRGFLTLGEETWIIATTRRFVGLLVVPPSVRPGFALHRLEAVLDDSEGPSLERPPRIQQARAQATTREEHVAADALEVAQVLGRLSDAPEGAGAEPWSLPERAGTIGG